VIIIVWKEYIVLYNKINKAILMQTP